MRRMIEEICRLSGILENNSGFRLAINFVDTATICQLNRDFVGHEGSTDVISFNYDTNGDSLNDDIDGELFICTNTAEEAAKRLKREFSDEIVLYIVHGILHISGEADSTVSERRRMRYLERKIIAELVKSFNFAEIFPGNSKCFLHLERM